MKSRNDRRLEVVGESGEQREKFRESFWILPAARRFPIMTPNTPVIPMTAAAAKVEESPSTNAGLVM